MSTDTAQGTAPGPSRVNAYLHPGDNPGYQSLALWLPDSSTAVVVLSNEETADIESTAVRSLREASANG